MSADVCLVTRLDRKQWLGYLAWLGCELVARREGNWIGVSLNRSGKVEE